METADPRRDGREAGEALVEMPPRDESGSLFHPLCSPFPALPAKKNHSRMVERKATCKGKAEGARRVQERGLSHAKARLDPTATSAWGHSSSSAPSGPEPSEVLPSLSHLTTLAQPTLTPPRFLGCFPSSLLTPSGAPISQL